ncbi:MULTISPECIES: DNA polymerase III subunit gamma/tau [unclassified Pseudodesulfovibrio]|uniref:DNA polymerase III subunit gamma/tau n=1 Tax=unclassified Pseudodesulfovibrio TaxID=2661612 RepID=UPI000FEBEFB5|nr:MULTISPECIES: DNA polymerase III subunit gamma/tau [unclassified Pseudodesulfovibrio]MCJ2163945.1 DNA polymerase III subunit gamma/tau [Pseudodesulfovibrio sp. S3-i]RWU05810.1 DNA polymerase III subunit gamma/tau [Pseudodesulfovibrio sp. S3]
MSTSNLTAKYRPQTFEEVAGQQAVKSILSRAAAQDKIAPAYLFSGTRGVGKTTIARIFAKALNCVNAPTGEPCNQCSNCKQITAGVAVDVIEIDGASNRGIDDARRLKEDIGYAPLECRYKVFIIDEAHMLTKEAFNALLKTLEEPPPRATFIMATTEHHKFPATIVSRCQHYTFKMLPQAELVTHLEKIMNLENLRYEAGALQIIAKRGAGSVRDSMSLLGQALAMGEDVLKEADVRGFLGLAGQDVFFGLMEAMHARNLVAVGHVLRQVLDQGLDLGFFLRELTNCWRNMFLLRQAGEEALPLLGFSGEEAVTWMDWAGRFEPAHIHACWQMTLDGQRKVMTSLEPALALELLLLNLTSLPDLINLESMTPRSPGSMPKPPMAGPGGAMQGGPGSVSGGMPRSGQQFSSPQTAPQPPRQEMNRPAPRQPVQSPQAQRPETPVQTRSEPEPEPDPVTPSDAPPMSEPPAQPRVEASIPGPRTWDGFLAFVEERNGRSGVKVAMLHLAEGKQKDEELVVTCKSRTLCSQLTEKQTLTALDSLTKEFFGPTVEVRVETGDIAVPKTDRQLMEEAENHPGVNKIMDAFSAQLVSVSPRKH